MDALDKYLIRHDIQNPLFFKFLILILFEHIILILVSLLILNIETQPKWLRVIYKLREYRKEIKIKFDKNKEIQGQIQRMNQNDAKFRRNKSG